MCLALPVQVTRLFDNKRAQVSLGGISKDISTIMLEDVKVGDYVIIHVGYALTKLDEGEAQKTLALFADMQGAKLP